MFWTPVAIPTLLLRGAESDLLLAETAHAMVQTKPAGLVTLVEFPGVGHAPSLTAEAEQAAVLSWLSER